jgi:DNA repair exonuclease SbcCD ATPase subunit
MHRAAEIAKDRFKPESITFASRVSGERGDIDKFSSDLQQEDLRDPVVIEKLMREYLKDYDTNDNLLQKVYDLNRKYTSIVQEGEEVSRNVNWQMKSLSWDNLFNYGDNNHINFEKLNGVVGIFGKNFSGKSSIIDSLLFTVFNTTSKNERKNLNVINQDKQAAKCSAEIVVNNNTFKIEREISKYTKKLKGQETLEAKVDLNFTKTDNITGETENLNGLSRNETDANIRRVFGTIDDFLNTSLSSQLDSLSFIREGSTKRKEILANFLDLDVFEKKFKAAKEDSVELKGALRRIGDRDFDKEIKEATESLFQSEKSLILKQSECRHVSEAKTDTETAIKELQAKIDSIPAEPIDIATITAKIDNNEKILASKESLLSESTNKRSDKIALLKKISSFVENFDQKDLIEKDQQLSAIGKSIGTLNETLKDIDKKQDLLNKVPCADAFPSCLFIKDAVIATKKKQDVSKDISDLQIVYNGLLAQKTAEKLKQLSDIQHKKNNAEIEVRNLDVSIGKLENEITKTKSDLIEFYSKKKIYDNNKEAIENLELLVQQKNNLNKQVAKLAADYKLCEDQINLIHRSIGSFEQKVADLQQQKEEIDNLRQEYAAYELFMRCMHSNGIAYDIIKKRLPIINEEIAKILANLTDFEAFFEEEGNKLEIFIRHSNSDPRPLAMASGAEKTMSAMAIRLALLSVSNLPKSDVMILDEPGTALDETHLQAFTQMLEMIKAKFRTVLLISHLEALKDVVDLTIEIDRKDGYALVNEN